MFSTKGSKAHSARKRLVSNVFSKSFVQSSNETHKITHTILFDRLLPVLDSHAANGFPIEILELNYAVTMDFVSSYLFGLSNDSNFIQDLPMRKRFLSWYFKRSEHGFWKAELPGLTRLVQSFGVHLEPRWVDKANSEIEAWVLRLCRAAEKSLMLLSESSEKAHRTRPVVYKQLSESLEKSSTKLGERHGDQRKELSVASELLDQVAAGMDTSGITLTYLFWEMSRNPSLQTALRDELLTLSPHLSMGQDGGIPSARSIDALPLLHAVVMETLRRHCAIPGSQPRVTPPTPTSVAGSPPLPGGVRISAQAYSLHRNEKVFPDAESWNHRRWLDAGPGQKDEMMRWFWAFGSGGRMCVGSNFAMQGKPI